VLPNFGLCYFGDIVLQFVSDVTVCFCIVAGEMFCLMPVLIDTFRNFNSLRTKHNLFYLKTLFILHSKHPPCLLL